MSALHCYGKSAYSPDRTTVCLFGETKSIDEWYVFSKRLINRLPAGVYAVPMELRDGYGLKPDCFEINSVRFETVDLSKWYLYLWYLYFLQNPVRLLKLHKYLKSAGKQGTNALSNAGKVLKYFNNGLKFGSRRSMKRVHRLVKQFEIDLFRLDPISPEQPPLDGHDDISFVPGTVGYPN